MQKLRYQLYKVANLVRKYTQGIKLDPESVALELFLLLIIFTMSYNVYNAYRKGLNDRDVIEHEQVKLNAELSEKHRLDELTEYYSSVEFKRIYARDVLNLAEPGEQLYFVDREETLTIEDSTQKKDPIIISNNREWWAKLILGI